MFWGLGQAPPLISYEFPSGIPKPRLNQGLGKRTPSSHPSLLDPDGRVQGQDLEQELDVFVPHAAAVMMAVLDETLGRARFPTQVTLVVETEEDKQVFESYVGRMSR